MKYLRSFNESVENVINDCQDILIDLADDGIKYKTSIIFHHKSSPRFGDAKGDIVIRIGDNVKRIELKKYEDNFERLFDYLESLGYHLGESSYYECDGEYTERCPNCSSFDIIPQDSSSPDWKNNNLQCNNCDYIDDCNMFATKEYPLDKSKLRESIKYNDKPEYMYLYFIKK
jgi:hypothetical protein